MSALFCKGRHTTLCQAAMLLMCRVGHKYIYKVGQKYKYILGWPEQYNYRYHTVRYIRRIIGGRNFRINNQ